MRKHSNIISLSLSESFTVRCVGADPAGRTHAEGILFFLLIVESCFIVRKQKTAPVPLHCLRYVRAREERNESLAYKPAI